MNSPLLAGSCRCLGWLRCTYSKYKNTLTASAKLQLQVWVNQSNEYITKTVVHAEAMYKIQVISINYESGSFQFCIGTNFIKLLGLGQRLQRIDIPVNTIVRFRMHETRNDVASDW